MVILREDIVNDVRKPKRISSKLNGLTNEISLFDEGPDDKNEKIERHTNQLQRAQESGILKLKRKSNKITMSNTEMSEHYATCIKLCAENKVNVNNAYKLHLIDYMSQIVHSQSQNDTNFQVASNTIDASTKIYSYRVDGYYSEAFKLLSILCQKSEERQKMNQDMQEDGIEGQLLPQKVKRTKARTVGCNIEKNVKNLLRTKPDNVPQIDPLFHRICLGFDSGSPSGLMLYNVAMKANDMFGIAFDNHYDQQLINEDTTNDVLNSNMGPDGNSYEHLNQIINEHFSSVDLKDLNICLATQEIGFADKYNSIDESRKQSCRLSNLNNHRNSSCSFLKEQHNFRNNERTSLNYPADLENDSEYSLCSIEGQVNAQGTTYLNNNGVGTNVRLSNELFLQKPNNSFMQPDFSTILLGGDKNSQNKNAGGYNMGLPLTPITESNGLFNEQSSDDSEDLCENFSNNEETFLPLIVGKGENNGQQNLTLRNNMAFNLNMDKVGDSIVSGPNQNLQLPQILIDMEQEVEKFLRPTNETTTNSTNQINQLNVDNITEMINNLNTKSQHIFPQTTVLTNGSHQTSSLLPTFNMSNVMNILEKRFLRSQNPAFTNSTSENLINRNNNNRKVSTVQQSGVRELKKPFKILFNIPNDPHENMENENPALNQPNFETLYHSSKNGKTTTRLPKITLNNWISKANSLLQKSIPLTELDTLIFIKHETNIFNDDMLLSNNNNNITTKLYTNKTKMNEKLLWWNQHEKRIQNELFSLALMPCFQISDMGQQSQKSSHNIIRKEFAELQNITTNLILSTQRQNAQNKRQVNSISNDQNSCLSKLNSTEHLLHYTTYVEKTSFRTSQNNVFALTVENLTHQSLLQTQTLANEWLEHISLQQQDLIIKNSKTANFSHQNIEGDILNDEKTLILNHNKNDNSFTGDCENNNDFDDDESFHNQNNQLSGNKSLQIAENISIQAENNDIMNETYMGQELLQPTRKIENLLIQYERKRRFTDMRALKRRLWELLKRNLLVESPPQNSQENVEINSNNKNPLHPMSPILFSQFDRVNKNPDDQNENEKGGPLLNHATYFSRLRDSIRSTDNMGVKNDESTFNMFQDVSEPILLLTLLFLANEKVLILLNTEDYGDIKVHLETMKNS